MPVIFVTGTESLALTVVKGPLEAIAGVVYGILLGIVFWYLPVTTGTVSSYKPQFFSSDLFSALISRLSHLNL